MKARKNNWLKFSYVGFQICASICLFGWIGHKIDQYFSISPYGLIISLFVGAAGSLYGIWVDSNRY